MTVRKLRVAALLAAATLALTACGGGGDDNDDAAAGGGAATTTAAAGGGTLTIWADEVRTKALQPLTTRFGQENGVTVTLQTIPGDKLQAQFVTASQAGKAPDLVLGAHDWIGNLVQNGTIDPVQLTSEQSGGFNPVAIKGVTFNGQVYGIPYAVENLALFRNTDLAPEAPATIDAMLAAGKALVASKKTTEAVAWPSGTTGNPYHGYPFYTAGGGYLFGKAANGDYDPKDLGLSKPEAAKAMANFQKYGEKGQGLFKRSITVDNDTALFTGKKVAFMVDGPWRIADLDKSGVKYDVSPVPGFTAGQPGKPFVGIQAMYVSSKSKNKALAQEFATNFFTQEDVQVALYKADPRPPALTGALDQVKGSSPNLQKFLDAGQDGDILPAIPEMASVWDPWGKAEAAIIGGADPTSTTSAAAKAIEKQIK
jgi:arabinogalactan oligomer / maltooligosaccharide transport system substrate-binding protein